MNVHALIESLRSSRGFLHKQDISQMMSALHRSLPGGVEDLHQAVPIGDDCAAIADRDGYLLFAIEGFVEDFIQRMPWFAGYCSVMVNVSDIYAMGGRPLAIVDALWSCGMQPADELLAGMSVAARRYGVPIVGGHSNARCERGQLAVAILGRANKLLSSFAAQPGDRLVVVTDLRGEYEQPFPYWNASTHAPAERLREDLEILPRLAEDGFCAAAKDISMAGVIGTTLMMLECSGVGGRIDIDALPKPKSLGAEQLLRWLTAFPSYGFVLSVKPAHVGAVLERFAARDLDAAVVGEVTAAPGVVIRHENESAELWDLASTPFINCGAKSAPLELKAYG